MSPGPPMSLSFPGLVSAVKLMVRDHTREKEDERRAWPALLTACGRSRIGALAGDPVKLRASSWARW